MLAKLTFHLKAYQLAQLILRLFPEAQILQWNYRAISYCFLLLGFDHIFYAYLIIITIHMKLTSTYPYKDCHLRDHQVLLLISLHLDDPVSSWLQFLGELFAMDFQALFFQVHPVQHVYLAKLGLIIFISKVRKDCIFLGFSIITLYHLEFSFCQYN